MYNNNNNNNNNNTNTQEIIDVITTLSRENIAKLTDQYRDNRYILNRINNYITNLPTMLEHDYVNYIKRQEHAYRVNESIRALTDNYIDTNNYYYCSSSEIYFKYDGSNYFTYRDDTILFEIASLVNRDPELLNYKHRIRQTIIREIKERNILDSIPDTATIQIIIHSLMPLFLNNKTYVKYFLAVLGDLILKKNDDYTYLIDNTYKRFIKTLSDLAYQYFGSNNFTNIKYGYHEVQRNCRIIYADKNILGNRYNNTIPNLLNNLNCKNNNNFLDLFIVGVYYSNRYENGDGFLVSHDCESNIKPSVMMLDNINHIIDDFVGQTFERCVNIDNTDTKTIIQDANIDERDTNKITNRNMHYLWRLYLIDNNLPNINFITSIKTVLRNKIDYNQETCLYSGITSKKLPLISNFLLFWNTTIKYKDIEETETNTWTEFDLFFHSSPGLEISEIVSLFKYWLHIGNKNIAGISITESSIIDLITYYYEAVHIEDDKYISCIFSTLWNKNQSILDYFNYYRDENKKLDSTKKMSINPNHLYTPYCKWCKETDRKFIVGKYDFLKFASAYLNDYIKDNLLDKE